MRKPSRTIDIKSKQNTNNEYVREQDLAEEICLFEVERIYSSVMEERDRQIKEKDKDNGVNYVM